MSRIIGKEQAILIKAFSGAAPVTGLMSGDVMAKYAGPSATSYSTFSIPAGKWQELGGGAYKLFLSAAAVGSTDGLLVCSVASSTASATFDEYIAKIDLIPEYGDVWDAVVDDHQDAGSFGKSIIQYEVFVATAFDHETGTLKAQVHVQRNGELVTDSGVLDSAYFLMYPMGVPGSPTVSKSCTGPDANGFFYATDSPISLVANQIYAVKARVTIDGVDKWSGESFTTVD